MEAGQEAWLPRKGHLGVEEGQEPAWQGCPGQQKYKREATRHLPRC